MDGESGSKKGLFNPVGETLASFKSGAKPSFSSDKKKAALSSAASGLKSAENNASSDVSQPEDNLSSVRQNESKAGGFYFGAGKAIGKAAVKAAGGKKAQIFIKKGGPVAGIIALIFGFGLFISGGQLLQPFSLVAQFIETFDSMHISASTRSNALMRYQLNNKLVKDPIKSKIFKEDTFKITSKQAAELSVRGIEYDDDFDGSGTRVLKYNDGSGEIKIIAADDTAASRLTGMDLSKFNTGDVKYSTEAVSFKDFYTSNTNFKNSYNDGSMTWRGAIANWFGSTTNKFLANNKLTRNLFKNFDQELKESGESPRTVATEMIAKSTEGVDEGGGVKVVNSDQAGDDSGDTTYSTTDPKDTKEDTGRSKVKSQAEVKTKLEKIGKAYGDGSGVAQKAANYACLGVNFIGGVSLLVAASEALQIIHLATSYFEAIDKVKAGDGNDSPLNTLIDALNEKKTNKNVELVYKKDANINSDMKNNVTNDGISALETKETTTEKSAMEANAMAALYSGTKVDTSDPSVQSFNFTSSVKRILGGLGTSMAAFETCAFAKLATSALGAALDGAKIAICIAGVLGAPITAGASALAGCSTLALSAVAGAAMSVAIGVLIAGIISTITPVVTNLLTRDLITNLGGEDLGNALVSGGSMYLSNAHRYNGGSLATKKEYEDYAVAQQQVIAEDAKLERSTKNPFDATSKYTFMGALLTQMMSFLSVNSLTSAITSTSSVVSSSLVALSPAASAYDIAKTLPDDEEYADTCPYLASIGAVGDAFCNPYSITDVSTLQSDPSEITNILDDNFKDELDSNGNVQIDGSSDLAKYILFCDNRSSAFGIADQDIVNQVSSWGTVNSKNSTFDNVANSAIGAVPVVGDIIDIVDNADALDNTGYIGGESCVAGNNVKGQSAPGWDKAKYYQRFIEDQSLMESMGIIKQSAVAVFLDDYYKENPLDNSYEGMLARYSGMSKEDVIALLDILEYENYIANYNPAERYAFGAPAVEMEKELRFNNENQVAENPVFTVLNQIVYADLRNRNFVA